MFVLVNICAFNLFYLKKNLVFFFLSDGQLLLKCFLIKPAFRKARDLNFSRFLSESTQAVFMVQDISKRKAKKNKEKDASKFLQLYQLCTSKREYIHTLEIYKITKRPPIVSLDRT